MIAHSPSKLLVELCADANTAGEVPEIILVAAHPDDEVIGAGARLPHWPHAAFVHVTDGAPRDLRDATTNGFATREDYARARRAERESLLNLAGIGLEQRHELNFVEQEASLHLVELSRTFAEIFRSLHPETVITHAYEGGHPDHDATAFAVHAAGELLQAQMISAPVIIEMTSCHNGSAGRVTSEFLSDAECDLMTKVLTKSERHLKRRLFDCYASQQKVLGQFPVERESFRVAPRYDFTQAPHEGELFYEKFDWGMTGARWRKLASRALDALGLSGPI